MYSYKAFKIISIFLLISQASAQDRVFRNSYEENTAPFITLVELTPEIAKENSLLMCSPSADDIDWDNLSFDYEWIVNNSTLVSQQSVTLNGNNFNRDDSVKCNVMAFDGQDSSGIVESNTIIIINTAPSITSVNISPGNATETSTLTCNANNIMDIDSDSVTVSYVWTINGQIIATTQPTLTGSNFDKSDGVRCTVIPNDGIEPGIAVNSSLITIQNSIPVLSSASISPSLIDEFTTASCIAGSINDVDGDSITFSYKWVVNNTQISTASSLDSSNYNAGDEIRCSIIPSDGASLGVEKFSTTKTVAPAA